MPCSANRVVPCSANRVVPCSATRVVPCSANRVVPCSANRVVPCSANRGVLTVLCRAVLRAGVHLPAVHSQSVIPRWGGHPWDSLHPGAALSPLRALPHHSQQWILPQGQYCYINCK